MNDKDAPKAATSKTLNQATCCMAFHRQIGSEPVESFGEPFDYQIKSEDDVYRRRYKIGEAPEQVDVGFVRDPSLIVIANTTKWEGATIPSDEEKRDIEKRVILILFGDSSCLEIHPGQSQPLFVSCDPASISIRSFYKEANVAVFAVPK